MQADNRKEKAEVQRVMWSPYPDHQLTLWAMAPHTSLPSSHLDGPSTVRSRQRRQLQGWQISRNFSSTSAKGRTTEILATHRLNFGNQSITRLCIPRASLEFLTALVELRMPQNKLKQLPHSLFELRGLEILNLENNALDEKCADDRWWPLLERLRVLFLAGNRFTQLPPSLGRMPHLFYVDVSDNHKLASLPAELVRAPSVGTLAASRCSLELAALLSPAQSLPFEDRVPANMPWSSPVRVPPLVALCLRTIGRASKQTTESRQTTEPSPARYDAISCTRLMDACAEVRRRPDDFVVLDRMLDTLRDMDGLCACSVCSEPVILGSFSFVRMEAGRELPVAWRCCSATCRDSCLEATV
ncbi:hypothetical protein IW147_001022 [Coemansia sp. RSA 720]|nr:hypothetical protein IW147_001022 [Coemansia sp. RSA 720]